VGGLAAEGLMPPGLAALAELVRAPAGLSIPGDVVLGRAAGGAAVAHPATAARIGSSVCLYYAGMAANDYFDRDLDAKERPERPIPSGRVAPATALGVAIGLTAAGVALGAAGGGLAGTATLAGTVWAYDAILKGTPAGPLAMAACRTLDVLLGAGPGRARRALPAAAIVGAHTLAITVVSANEVEGGDRRMGPLAGAATAAVAVAALATARAGRVVPVALLGVYAARMGRAAVRAMQDPSPANQQAIVGAGIGGLIPLTAALTAGAGRTAAGLATAALLPLAGVLRRKAAVT
jgi:4-hydroxybenzoate polyprenyltransferase